ncbi:hypothetical protein ACM46_17065 [Chryseobacterium angstadtii]|uniref:DUF3828 domain-containing protein n=1 Tax=Chryseobacterium angstadtii TaxID=558151 RepID=A0A0J7I109_9FLAO|nr:hypothetical protein [Chryseobacterium angstadtii]KMQ59967.1 hypothetical protein ACM46_17065 [Chryseobacterium angstadtii]
MKKILIASVLMMAACKEEKKETPIHPEFPPKEVVKVENKSTESEEAKKWLETSIENYFNSDLGSLDKEMQRITTKDYYEYKTDAMNVDMDVDRSLTEKEFQDKWKGKFDTGKAGIGYGFLITAQDWDKIKVSTCHLISESKTDMLFDTVLSDENLKAEYPVKIKIAKENDSFLIADVLQ